MKRRKRSSKQPVVLVFGEDEHDRTALKHLLRTLCPNTCPPIKTRRKPMVLVKNREDAEQRKNAATIANTARSDSVTRDVRLVVAHEDCDAPEPAHETLAKRIEGLLEAEGFKAVAAVPAWEMEAWWYLWPQAVLAVNNKWRHPDREGTEVGRLSHAKEQLRRDLRPTGERPTRDYDESDSPEIARNVASMNLIESPEAKSYSFERFASRVKRLLD